MGQDIAEAVKNNSPVYFDFPNPNHGNFTIKTNLLNVTIKIYDISGRLIKQQSERTVNLTTPGVYILQVYHRGKFIKTEKLIVAR